MRVLEHKDRKARVGIWAKLEEMVICVSYLQEMKVVWRYGHISY